MFELLFCAGQALGSTIAGHPIATLSNIVVNPFSGACGGFNGIDQSATLTVLWTVTNANDADYEIHVLVNGAYLVTVPTSTTGYDYSMGGLVEFAPLSARDITTDFTVNVVRLSDGATMQTLSASYTGNYGTCPSV